MRTLIFALCFAAVSPAATVITIPSWSSTLAGGEVLSLSGGTLTAPLGSNGALSMTATLDATTFGTASIPGSIFLDFPLTANGTPVTLRLVNHWTVTGGVGTWTFGLDRTTILTDEDGQSGFITIASASLPSALGQAAQTLS